MRLTETIREIVQECLAKGRKFFPRPLMHIHDQSDQESDFLYGVALGLKKINWEIGDPKQFLIRNGIFYLRMKRFRAMRRKFLIRCECGCKLRMSQKPCHGTMDTRTVISREIVMDPCDFILDSQLTRMIHKKRYRFGSWKQAMFSEGGYYARHS